ncbi:MAG: hypothetical protein WDZ91_16110 [Paenibacillaceae bacterium]
MTGLNYLELKLEKGKIIFIMNGASSLDLDVISVMDTWSERSNMHVGLSSVSDDIDDMLRLFREANMAVSNHFIHANSGITRFFANRNTELESVVMKTEKLMMIKNYEEICSLMDSIPDIFDNGGLGIYHVTCLWNQFAILIGKRLDGDSLTTKIDFLDHEEILNRFHNLSAMCAHLKELLRNICYSLDQDSVKPNNYILGENVL